jgi:hypothetical protein
MKSSVRQLPNLWEIVVHTIEFMPTSVGEARVAWYPAVGKPRAILTVGHGNRHRGPRPATAGENAAGSGDHGRARRTALPRCR